MHSFQTCWEKCNEKNADNSQHQVTIQSKFVSYMNKNVNTCEQRTKELQKKTPMQQSPDTVDKVAFTADNA